MNVFNHKIFYLQFPFKWNQFYVINLLKTCTKKIYIYILLKTNY